MISCLCRFQIHASHRRLGAFFTKNKQSYQEEGVQSIKNTKKMQMAHEIWKIAGVLHAVVFADGALEAKNAQVMGRLQNFDRGTERKKSEPNEPKGDKSEQKWQK